MQGSFSFSFCSRQRRKGLYPLRPVSQQSPPRLPSKQRQCLVEHRSFPTSEGGVSAATFVHFLFLQAITAVMLWPAYVQKVPQASEHLCPAKLQTSCNVYCACQSICPFSPADSGMPMAVEQTRVPQSGQWLTAVAILLAESPSFCYLIL